MGQADSLQKLPPTNESLNEILKTKQIQTEITFPVNNHEQVPEALQLIRENFPEAQIPNYIFAVPDLLKPDREIFNTNPKDQTKDTTLKLMETDETEPILITNNHDWNQDAYIYRLYEHYTK